MRKRLTSLPAGDITKRNCVTERSFIFETRQGPPTGQAGASDIPRINPFTSGGGLTFVTDPGGIGYAFHGAGPEIGQRGAFFKGFKE
jgi:hypothetical protein